MLGFLLDMSWIVFFCLFETSLFFSDLVKIGIILRRSYSVLLIIRLEAKTFSPSTSICKKRETAKYCACFTCFSIGVIINNWVVDKHLLYHCQFELSLPYSSSILSCYHSISIFFFFYLLYKVFIWTDT